MAVRLAVTQDVAGSKPAAPVMVDKIKTRFVQLKPKLTRLAALRAARRKSPGDARGFTYDPKTGKASLT